MKKHLSKVTLFTFIIASMVIYHTFPAQANASIYDEDCLCECCVHNDHVGHETNETKDVPTCKHCGNVLSSWYYYTDRTSTCTQHSNCVVIKSYKVVVWLCSWNSCPNPTSLVSEELLSTRHVPIN